MGDISISNGNCINGYGHRKSCWYEEEIEENLRWCFALNGILHTGATQFQDIQLLDTKPFGKALVIDGKLQSAEIDEFIYHESLVHPALLNHLNPKTIFIMGGGEGSTAREILRHGPVEKKKVLRHPQIPSTMQLAQMWRIKNPQISSRCLFSTSLSLHFLFYSRKSFT
ncbi:unnamed protein product [Fraxinus pennsylvanica]|uniref:PABS domain-containing protein n=1 Tax=Fraxinus pennsylvanica TaxID=56036 RepID=A0AAD1ZX74_9LAMI|nr:unnamed protein product [Fraxinus pennsylvanica]